MGLFHVICITDREPHTLLIDITPDLLSQQKNVAEQIVIPFWSASDQGKYTTMLRDGGLHQIEARTYQQRDGNVAFYVISGKF
jgi:hypothetical protein